MFSTRVSSKYIYLFFNIKPIKNFDYTKMTSTNAFPFQKSLKNVGIMIKQNCYRRRYIFFRLSDREYTARLMVVQLMDVILVENELFHF